MYDVEWEQSALEKLDQIWLASIDREGVENAATRVNIELTYNPTEAGESRGADFRILFKYPIIVWFRVIERMKQVQVLHVQSIRPG